MNIDPAPLLPASPIRIVLIDDHGLLRETMKQILNDQTDLQVVGDASGNNEGLVLIEKEQPAIVIQDICVGEDNGLDMLRHLKDTAPQIKCLVLTGFTEDDFILEAIQNHADGYLLKTCSMLTLINAIRQLAAGHKCWDETILKRLTDLHSLKRLAVGEGKIEYLSPGKKKYPDWWQKG